MLDAFERQNNTLRGTVLIYTAGNQSIRDHTYQLLRCEVLCIWKISHII